jgi:hypothetical protein
MHVIRLLFAVAACGLLLAPAAKAGPNVALCVALENNFNECMRQQQRQNAAGGWNNGYGQGYGHSWGDNDWDEGYGRHPHPYAAKQAECARWLTAIQQNNCVR